MKDMKLLLTTILLFSRFFCFATAILIPMDDSQRNHLKAYGIAYWVIEKGQEVDWLLNYKGGSFVTEHNVTVEKEIIARGISYQLISNTERSELAQQLSAADVNMDVVKLEKAPKIAVYSPKTKQPWDDAVTMVLTYAEIPYTVIFDDEVMYNELPKFDWLHLHHEDFTGQYGKFYASYANAQWYQDQQRSYAESARKHGFNKVSQLKLATVKKIKDFVTGGGFLFAMCSATDTYDIALSAEGVDICEQMFDGDPADQNANSKLDFSQTIAFKDYNLIMNPFEYEYSYIDASPETRPINENNDVFTLFDFSAKWDLVPTMLCQNHTSTIKGFMGQTTAFRKQFIKSEVLILGENKQLKEARYIHGNLGKGTWTFYGGHDPEDYQHIVGEPPTDLNLHPNSPGYRLILNNILFPSAKKKKLKT